MTAVKLNNTNTNISVSSDNKLISDETTRIVFLVLLYGVSPVISVVGVTGNIFSLFVLVKHGLHKCSNILLFCLAITDMGYLTAYNNVPNMLYSVEGDDTFHYSRSVSTILYVFYFAFFVVDYSMALSSLCIPVLITLERVITVFVPLKCRLIVTPLRTWSAIAILVIFHTASVIYNCFWFRFEYSFDYAHNSSVGLIVKSDLYYKDLPGIVYFEEIFYSLKLYPALTLVGCIAIIVKVKQVSRKRQKMTSKVSSTSKTTQILLVVCFGYILTCVVTGLPSYLPDRFSGFSMTSDEPTNTGKIVYLITNVWLQINGSWNFFIYVAFNKNFRDTLREMCDIRCCRNYVTNLRCASQR